MKREVETKFFTFDQNNSGGYIIKNDDVSSYVIIEACTKEDAIIRFKNIVENYSEYCECCGERWSTWSIKETDEIPDNLQIVTCCDIDEAIIYYFDESKARYDLLSEEIVSI